MFIKIVKLSVDTNKIDKLVNEKGNDLVRMARSKDGCLAARMFEVVDQPHNFFFISWWKDLNALNSMFGSDEYIQMKAEAKSFMIERTNKIRLESLVVRDKKMPKGHAEKPVFQILKLIIDPSEGLDKMEKEVIPAIEKYASSLPQVHYYEIARGVKSKHIYYLFTFLDSLEFFNNVSLTDSFLEIESFVKSVQQERFPEWFAKLVIDDERNPLIAE